MLRFLAETVAEGIVERRFELSVAEAIVPGLLWHSAGAAGARPLVLIAHGGFQHKRIQLIVELAERLVREFGYAIASLDLPDHGERLTREERLRQRQEGSRWTPPGSEFRDFPSSVPLRSRIAVVEWRTALDALQALPEVGAAPVGFWGVSMGSALGIRLVAAEPRISAAVFGLWGLRADQNEIVPAAHSIAIPLLFLVQYHDTSFTLQTALNLYDAFGSHEKSMHINPGPHLPLPRYELDASVAFLARHLGSRGARGDAISQGTPLE